MKDQGQCPIFDSNYATLDHHCHVPVGSSGGRPRKFRGFHSCQRGPNPSTLAAVERTSSACARIATACAIMPKEPKRSSRQRPISCHFCRSRKLRCSRDAPCTNCTSRGIECELVTIARESSETNASSKAELVERIRILERLLQSPNRDTHPQPSSYVGSPAQSESHTLATEPKTNRSPDVEHLDSDVAWLSSIYDGSNRAVSFIQPCA